MCITKRTRVENIKFRTILIKKGVENGRKPMKHKRQRGHMRKAAVAGESKLLYKLLG